MMEENKFCPNLRELALLRDLTKGNNPVSENISQDVAAFIKEKAEEKISYLLSDASNIETTPSFEIMEKKLEGILEIVKRLNQIYPD